MKKIMFNDRYGLTQAVLDGRKTQTRRIITCPKTFKGEDVAGFHVYRRMSDNAILEYPIMYDADERDFDGGYIEPKYKVGEVVAVAQRYRDVGLNHPDPDYFVEQIAKAHHVEDVDTELLPGWRNKMFVKAELMPNRIRITDIQVERLQDISNDDDCIKEGIRRILPDFAVQPTLYEAAGLLHDNPRDAFASLIDKVSGRGTWERNPWVIVYEFELVR